MNINNIYLNPGITVQVENESGMGWKLNDPKEREKCKDKSAELFRKCVERLAFAANESIKTSESSKYFTEIIKSTFRYSDYLEGFALWRISGYLC